MEDLQEKKKKEITQGELYVRNRIGYLKYRYLLGYLKYPWWMMVRCWWMMVHCWWMMVHWMKVPETHTTKIDNSENLYLAFFEAVSDSQAALEWLKDLEDEQESKLTKTFEKSDNRNDVKGLDE